MTWILEYFGFIACHLANFSGGGDYEKRSEPTYDQHGESEAGRHEFHYKVLQHYGAMI
jgi:hypothetical protein